ncbi:TIGR02285 family protein [Thalassotalea sediminis]|uniref:TIGR02285 family protein n=1 Tax=Thalassotalea sediminis TaxID=1759089 RepID=UPI002573C6DD|nr:TIGR02285 family protein [Thalassotalea sediminis]
MNLIVKSWILGIILFITSANSEAKETIIWRVLDWPPFYILHGPDKGQGIYDVILNNITAKMPHYHHKKVVMNTQRLLAEFAKKTKVCSASALANTPAILSKVNSFLLPHQLIYHKDDFPSFSLQASISLTRLLKNEKIKLGIATQRYPQIINDIIQKNQTNTNILRQNNYNSLVRMFFRRRFDALIEYPPVINYSKHQLGLSLNSQSIAIKEISSLKYLSVHFACSDSPWGKDVINAIDRLLVQEATSENYLPSRLRWYERNDKDALKTYYLDHYLNDKKTPSLVTKTTEGEFDK